MVLEKKKTRFLDEEFSFHKENEVRGLFRAQNISLKTSLSKLSLSLSSRMFFLLKKRGLNTLEDLIVLCFRPRLVDFPNVGKKAIRKLQDSVDFSWEGSYQDFNLNVSDPLKEAFEFLGVKTISEIELLLGNRYGTGSARFGYEKLIQLRISLGEILKPDFRGEDIPTTPDELVNLILSTYLREERCLAIIQDRLLGGKTLSQCGQKWDITRERIRQLEREILWGLKKDFGKQALLVSRPLLYALEESGGLLPVEVLPQYDCSNPGVASLSLLLCGISGYRVWISSTGNQYLTKSRTGKLKEMARRLRFNIKESYGFVVDIGKVSQVACSGEGICLEPEVLAHFLADLDIADSYGESSIKLSGTISSMIESLMRRASGKLSLKEVKKSLAISKVSLQTVINTLHNNHNIYPVPGGYIHAKNFPYFSELKKLVERAVPYIEGEPSPVGVGWLLKKLGPSVPISPMTFKRALGFHPGIISLGSSHQVAWKSSFIDSGVNLTARILRILEEASCPLSSEEIKGKLPPKVSYADITISSLLHNNKKIIRVSGGWSLFSSLGFGENTEKVLKRFTTYFSKSTARILPEEVLFEELKTWGYEFSPSKGIPLPEALLSLLSCHFKTRNLGEAILHPRYSTMMGLVKGILEEESPVTGKQIYEVCFSECPTIKKEEIRGALSSLRQLKKVVSYENGFYFLSKDNLLIKG